MNFFSVCSLCLGVLGSGHAASAQTCLVRLSDPVPNACKDAATLGSTEFNVRNLPDWSDNLGTSFNGGACPGTQACAVQKGDQLCAWFVNSSNQGGQTGTQFSLGVGCYPSDQCTPGQVFKADAQTQIPPDGNPCTGGGVCCIPKNPKNEAASASTAGAGGAAPGGTIALPDPLGGVSLPQLIGNVIRTFSGVAGAIALLMFVYGGIMWILSGGEGAKVTAAKKILMNASIGLVLVFGAYLFTAAIIQAILSNPSAINQ